jgi:hypothetical protein
MWGLSEPECLEDETPRRIPHAKGISGGKPSVPIPNQGVNCKCDGGVSLGKVCDLPTEVRCKSCSTGFKLNGN